MKRRAMALSFMLALGIACVLCCGGIVSESDVPFGDSEHYILRALRLHGHLHHGQWAQFWELFTLPKQSLAPPYYWIFFLLPQAWAGIISYGIIQSVTTYLMLALGADALCRAFDRVEWTAPFFLLCATQNTSLDIAYFYFADVPFCAVGTLALAWQVRAWRGPGWKRSLVSGVGASLLFWVKSPNALIFTLTYFLAEIVRQLLVWRNLGPDAAVKQAWRKDLTQHAAGVLAGYVPMTLLTLACGGLQSIMRLINLNEVSGLFVTNLTCTGLQRFFYFPLCLTFFYHTGLLLLILVIVLVITMKMDWGNAPSYVRLEPETRFRGDLLLPLIVAYVALGEFFSFGMQSKEMRVMLIVLPVFWLAIFWLLERFRVRIGVLFLAVSTYVVCAFSQIFFNTFESTEVNPQDYQIEGDWLSRLPQLHYINSSYFQMTQNLMTMIQESIPEGGKVAIGSEELGLTSESLTWFLQRDLALQGKEAPYQFSNFLTYRGEYCREPLRGARGILVIVLPSLQYSPDVLQTSNTLAQFCGRQWLDRDHSARIVAMDTANSEHLGYLIVMNQPLRDDQISEMIRATGGVEFTQGTAFDMGNDRRLSWRECWDLLVKWKQRRLGE